MSLSLNDVRRRNSVPSSSQGLVSVFEINISVSSNVFITSMLRYDPKGN